MAENKNKKKRERNNIGDNGNNQNFDSTGGSPVKKLKTKKHLPRNQRKYNEIFLQETFQGALTI